MNRLIVFLHARLRIGMFIVRRLQKYPTVAIAFNCRQPCPNTALHSSSHCLQASFDIVKRPQYLREHRVNKQPKQQFVSNIKHVLLAIGLRT